MSLVKLNSDHTSHIHPFQEYAQASVYINTATKHEELEDSLECLSDVKRVQAGEPYESVVPPQVNVIETGSLTSSRHNCQVVPQHPRQ